MKVAILGFGTVGVGVYEMLQHAPGFEPGPVLVRAGKEDQPFKVSSMERIVNDPEVFAVAEVMGGIEPANSYVAMALRAGKHVVTSNKALVAAHGIELAAIAREMVFDHIFCAKYMPPFPDSEELVKKAKQAGYPIYLLSNAGQDFHEYSKGIPALSYFDGFYVSSDHKLLKPEREIYLSFLDMFSLNAEDCLFIDDMQVNIDGAKNVGMDGICFNASRQPIKDLYDALAEKGIAL